MEQENPWPRGFALGGSSTINFDLFVRGNPNDYDSWARDGIDGWSWKDVLPYFLKLEDQTDPRYMREGKHIYYFTFFKSLQLYRRITYFSNFNYIGLHARGGPLTIESLSYMSPVIKGLLEAGRLFGYDTVPLNGKRHVGFAIPQGTLRNKERWSTASAYLLPASLRPNVHVLKDAFVTKV